MDFQNGHILVQASMDCSQLSKRVNDQWHHGRRNPRCQIVGSSTREEITTEANFQSLSTH